MLSDQQIILISNNYLRNAVSLETNTAIDYIHTIMIIGSYCQPLTIRKNSDIDLIFILDDKYFENYNDFKINYSTNFIVYEDKQITLPIDIKAYSISSFRKEMYHGSLTRVFAITNAYRILCKENDSIEEILLDAEERLNICVKETKKTLSSLNTEYEISNLSNYFNDSLSNLLSEKLDSNTILVQLRFHEYLKDLLVQFQKILFSTDIKNIKNTFKLDECIKNFLIFKNIDGTRLIDFNKYFIDVRFKQLLDDLNAILSHKYGGPYRNIINESYKCIDNAFITYIGYSLANSKSHYKYFSYMSI